MTRVNHLLTHRCRLRMRVRRRVGLERPCLNIDADRWLAIRRLANGTSAAGQCGVGSRYDASYRHSQRQPVQPAGYDSVRSAQ